MRKIQNPSNRVMVSESGGPIQDEWFALWVLKQMYKAAQLPAKSVGWEIGIGV